MPVSELVQEAVTLMLSGGSALSEIEAFIEDQPLCEDQKAALWALGVGRGVARRPLISALPTGPRSHQ